jgi:hypothetical protein
MTEELPAQRPSAGQALLEWHRLRGEIYAFNKEWRPRPREEDIMRVAWDMISLYDVSTYYVKSLLGGLSSIWSHTPL